MAVEEDTGWDNWGNLNLFEHGIRELLGFIGGMITALWLCRRISYLRRCIHTCAGMESHGVCKFQHFGQDEKEKGVERQMWHNIKKSVNLSEDVLSFLSPPCGFIFKIKSWSGQKIKGYYVILLFFIKLFKMLETPAMCISVCACVCARARACVCVCVHRG